MTFTLFVRYFKPFFSPEALNALVIDTPAFSSQEHCNAPVAVPPKPTGQGDDPGPQTILFDACDYFVALR
jgi:hypothetical protein